MPNSREHSKITANAAALVDSGEFSTAGLIGEYCQYPDLYFSDPVRLAPYYFETDGVQFHYPPCTPYEELYRYWTFRDGKLRRLRKFRNENHLHMTNGFRHYLTGCLEAGDSEEMLKFAGTLLHALEDALFSLHALEGAGGADLMFLDRLDFFEEPPTVQLVALSALDLPDIPDYRPRQLGNSVEEVVMNLYTEYVRRNQDSRRCCFQYLMERYRKGTAEDLERPVRRMYRNAVTLCADLLHTIFALRRGAAAEPHDYLLTEIEPFEFPFGGSASMAFRFRSCGRDTSYDRNGKSVPLMLNIHGKNTVFQHGISFGVHYENSLLFQLPKGMFRSFSAVIGLAQEEGGKNSVTLELVNDGSVRGRFTLAHDGNSSQRVEVSCPGGIFGFREFSEKPSGILMIGEGILKNRSASCHPN